MRLEELGADDLAALVALPASVGWLDSMADWRTLLACARVFGHRDETGAIVSCGALVDHGGVGFVAKMVVRPELQGRGLGRAVLAEVMSAARPGTLLALVATAMGAPVYARAGFVEVGRIDKLVAPDGAGQREVAGRAPGPGSRGASPQLELLGAADVEAVLALDHEIYGADRGRMLRARIAQAREGRVLRAGGRVVGFGLATAQGALTVLGPVLAPDAAGATVLVAALAARAPGALRIDVPAEHTELTARLGARGFARVDHPAVMTLAGVALPGARTRLFALAAQAFG
ncbi:MAG: GNAT family N-acetyltransferase [Deltaproteobacteria bacterium]|nr:GNAT family N-acetyltransferase [Deltaproteobacteria bacterium]